jgi:SAM-dependent methyltransferase
MRNENNNLIEIANYYSKKIMEHGQSPKGVDWNGSESQVIRFEQLCKIVTDNTKKIAINDIGCGYGALVDFLSENFQNFSYIGVDISDEMIQAAQSRHAGRENIKFLNSAEPDSICDFGIASGIFNVRLGRSDHEWDAYMLETLDLIDRTSRLGFAFNCLTSYSDEDKKRDYLYYADPCKIFDICKRRYSKQIALLHDYGLYEFSILVRKS